MIKHIKEFERVLMTLYDKLQHLLPETHCLTFSVTQTKSRKLRYLYGFIHIGGKCYSFDRAADLVDMVDAKFAENRVLYQNFDRLRGILK